MDVSDDSPSKPMAQDVGTGEIADLPHPGVRIAILGPGLSSPTDAGFQKREQIRNTLMSDGHQPFFPEDPGMLVPNHPLEPILEQQQRLLSSPDIQLIIVLYTPKSIGAAFELGHIMAIPEIKSKTAVLFPSEYYSPNQTLAANTVREFFARLPYTDTHFQVCQLVDECRRWARDMQIGNWPGLVPFQA